MLAELIKLREEIEATFADKITFANNRIEQLKGEKTELDKEIIITVSAFKQKANAFVVVLILLEVVLYGIIQVRQ
mgnify:CR=1 FL=1